MKKTRFLLMALVAMLSVGLCSCEREEEYNDISSETFPVTLGYYHPEKKLKRIVVLDSGNSNQLYKKITYDFTWDGSNLAKITFREEYPSSSYTSITGWLNYSYNNNGYIDSIYFHSEKYDFDVPTFENHYYNILYETVSYNELFDRDTWYNVTTLVDGEEAEHEYQYNFTDNDLAFWSNGDGTSHIGELEDGNYNTYKNVLYDTKKNPFKNLIIPRHAYLDMIFYAHVCEPLPFISANNVIECELFKPNYNHYNFQYWYNGNYPVAIQYGNQYHYVKLEYY